MTLDLFRPFFRVLIDPIASELEDLGVGPNSLSVASLFFAALARCFPLFQVFIPCWAHGLPKRSL